MAMKFTLTFAADKVDVFVGDTFDREVFVTLGLSDVNEVFGLASVVERTVDETGADLTRDAVDDTVEVVVVFVALTRDVVLVAGLVTVLKIHGIVIRYEEIPNCKKRRKKRRKEYEKMALNKHTNKLPSTQWNSRSSGCAWLRYSCFRSCKQIYRCYFFSELLSIIVLLLIIASILNVPVVVALAVRAVAGFDAVDNGARVEPTADFVTVLVVVVVFFVTVDVTPAEAK